MSSEQSPEYGYPLAYRLAREELAKIDNLEQQCLKSDARYIDPHKVIIDYLNQTYQVTLPDAEVSPVGSGEIPLREKLLILHYFIRAKGTPLANKVIAYKELADGANYYPVFFKRAIKPLLDNFGSEPGRLLEVAASLGGRKADYGDAAVTINAFSRVPVTLVLWQGDAEFAPNGNIMFDSTIADYLSTDDINTLCEILAWRLVRRLKAKG